MALPTISVTSQLREEGIDFILSTMELKSNEAFRMLSDAPLLSSPSLRLLGCGSGPGKETGDGTGSPGLAAFHLSYSSMQASLCWSSVLEGFTWNYQKIISRILKHITVYKADPFLSTDFTPELLSQFSIGGWFQRCNLFSRSLGQSFIILDHASCPMFSECLPGICSDLLHKSVRGTCEKFEEHL